MGRDIGTNVYSNNFEPQVMGLLDARGHAATKADLTTTAQWTSTDGNIYAPKAILVAVTDDPIAANNGLYMLKGDDYSVASNWMQINSGETPSNVKVLTTANLIDSSRTSAVQISLADISTLRSATDKDVFVYNGVIGGMTTTIPMTITFTQPPATALQMVISYAFIDRTYYIAVSATDTTQKDVLYADAPREMANGSGGGSSTSNVKVLTTPDLLNTSRTSTINLSAADIAIIKGLLVGKDIVVYSGNVGAGKFYIPLNIANAGSNNIQIYQTTVLMGGVIYTFTINTTNLTTYTASKLTKIEGSGGGEPEVEIINLSEIAAVNDTNLTASESLKTELEKLYDVVASTKIPFANWFDNIEGKYPISIKDDSGTNTTFTVLFNNELWEVDYNRAKSTYSTTKVGNGQGAYLTTLDLAGTITGDKLDQLQYDEIVNIYNKCKAGIPVVISMRDNYQGALNIYSNYGGITDRSTITFTIIYGDYVESWSVLTRIDSSWERVYRRLSTEISLYDIVAENATDLLTSYGEELYDSIMMLDRLALNGIPVYANYFDSLSGHYPISIIESFPSFVVNYSGREFQIDYQINRDNTITYSVTDVTKYDLSLDVRISNNKIQYRIHEVAPNGYICFYRKKRCRNSITDRPHVNKYTIPDFYFSSKIGTLGFPAIKKKYMIPASDVQVNTWTDFPMEVLNVFSTNSTTSVGFTGTVHATSCNKDTTTNNWDKWVTVLNMGLAYNVVNPNFINGIKENNAYPTDIIQSGDMVKFKCRLMVPYELRYTMY